MSYTNTYGAMTDNALQRTNNYYIQITHTDVKLSIKILITAQSKSLITNTFYLKSVTPTLPEYWVKQAEYWVKQAETSLGKQ